MAVKVIRRASLPRSTMTTMSLLEISSSANPSIPTHPSNCTTGLSKTPFPATGRQESGREFRCVDQVIIICGEYTHLATGVAAELSIARDEKKPYFLLWGYSGKTCMKPTSALTDDKIYNWTWDNLKTLIGGGR